MDHFKKSLTRGKGNGRFFFPPVKNLILCFAALFLSGCAMEKDPLLNAKDETAIPARIESIEDEITLVGNVKYSQSMKMVWNTSGVVEKTTVKNGDFVKKGQIMASLESSSLSSSVVLMEKTMLDAQDKLTDVMSSTIEKEKAYQALIEKESALKSAKSSQEALYYARANKFEKEMSYDDYMLSVINFNYAKQDYDSVKNTKGWEDEARRTYYDAYKTTYQKMVDAYQKWQWNKSLPEDTDFAVAQGAVEKAQVEYDDALEKYLSYAKMPREKDAQAAQLSASSAENDYNKRNIIAPFDGVVSSVSAFEGQYVEKGAAAFQVDDMSQAFIPVNISEIDISKIAVGQEAIIILDAAPNKTYAGRVHSIAKIGEQANGKSTSFGALIAFDQPDGALKSGMTGEVRLALNRK